MKDDSAKFNKRAVTFTEYKGWTIARMPFHPMYAAIPPDSKNAVLFKLDKEKIKEFIRMEKEKEHKG